MKIKVSNLGFLKKADIKLAPLTLLVGNNNTGKTYLSYFIFILLKSLRQIDISYKELNSKKQLVITKELLKEKIDEVTKVVCKNLGKKFAAPSNLFSKVKCLFEVDIDDLFVFLQRESQIGKLEASFLDSHGRILIWAEVNNDQIIWSLSVNEKNSKYLSIWTDTIARATVFNMMLKEHISRWINPIAITSERTGISLFYKELDSTRGALLDLLVEKTLPSDKYQLLDYIDKSISKYALPIKTNINTIRQAGDYKSYSFLWENKQKYKVLFQLWEQLVNGRFNIQKDSIQFAQDTDKTVIPLHLASSSSKSLLLLEIYLKYQARYRDLLLIDEPELNLHPQAQRIMARFLVQLVQAGIKVVITTHSEIIIRELNNLIMLYSVKDKVNSDTFKLYYFPNEGLRSKDVVAYITTSQHNLIEAPINKYGLNISSFEDFIDKTNEISNEIMSLLEDL